jgi:hypothetical protein
MSYDPNPELDDAEAKIAVAQAEITALKEKLRQHEANPPSGSQANVYNFTQEGLTVLRDAIHRTGSRYGTPVIQPEATAVNADLSKLGGVHAELLNSGTGGTRPPLLEIKDVLEVLSISAPSTDEIHITQALRELAGAPKFRINPVHPDPPASTQAQIVAAKLELRPELAEEVFRLLWAGMR